MNLNPNPPYVVDGLPLFVAFDPEGQTWVAADPLAHVLSAPVRSVGPIDTPMLRQCSYATLSSIVEALPAVGALYRKRPDLFKPHSIPITGLVHLPVNPLSIKGPNVDRLKDWPDWVPQSSSVDPEKLELIPATVLMRTLQAQRMRPGDDPAWADLLARTIESRIERSGRSRALRAKVPELMSLKRRPPTTKAPNKEQSKLYQITIRGKLQYQLYTASQLRRRAATLLGTQAGVTWGPAQDIATMPGTPNGHVLVDIEAIQTGTNKVLKHFDRFERAVNNHLLVSVDIVCVFAPYKTTLHRPGTQEFAAALRNQQVLVQALS